MQTAFTDQQRTDPDFATSEQVLRSCVHCGFCLATCPTYLLLGDEADSPRGRIVLIRDMLEAGGAPAPDTVTYIDRCLSCLACMTTCPSGVHYMHLVDHAREHIETHARRPLIERVLRRALVAILPSPRRTRVALALARRFQGAIARATRLLARSQMARVDALLRLLPARPATSAPLAPGTYSPSGRVRARVALLTGCVQQALAPEINRATVRLLNRLGCEVVVAEGTGCCGALAHHLGDKAAAHAAARANVTAWSDPAQMGRLDAIVANASGCGTMLKDYGHLLRADPRAADAAARIASLARDVSELVTQLGIPKRAPRSAGLRVAYQSACSLQHGQKVTAAPQQLLTAAGFILVEPAEAHICCGSAGTYNIMQPELATQLRDRKAQALHATRPDVIASGNIGCITQLAPAVDVPILHTVELLDWATGGPRPRAIPEA